MPLSLRLRWLATPGSRSDKERAWRSGGGKRRPQLIFAIVEQFRLFYYSSIAFKIGGDTCQMFSPIRACSLKRSFRFATDSTALPLTHAAQSPGESRQPSPCVSLDLTPVALHFLRYIIYFAQDTVRARQNGEPLPSRGKGVGMAIGMWLLSVVWSALTHQGLPCLPFESTLKRHRLTSSTTRLSRQSGGAA